MFGGLLARIANNLLKRVRTDGIPQALADARYGLLFGAALARAHQGVALGVHKLVGSTLLLVALWGSLRELIADDYRHVALR